MKTANWKYVNDQISVMTHFDEVSAVDGGPNAFSHSLALQRTRPSRCGCDHAPSRAGSLSFDSLGIRPFA
jgi:hypothetical protein